MFICVQNTIQRASVYFHVCTMMINPSQMPFASSILHGLLIGYFKYDFNYYLLSFFFHFFPFSRILCYSKKKKGKILRHEEANRTCCCCCFFADGSYLRKFLSCRFIFLHRINERHQFSYYHWLLSYQTMAIIEIDHLKSSQYCSISMHTQRQQIYSNDLEIIEYKSHL